MLKFSITTHFSASNALVIDGLVKRGMKPEFIIIQKSSALSKNPLKKFVQSQFLRFTACRGYSEWKALRASRRVIEDADYKRFFVGMAKRLEELNLKKYSPDTKVIFTPNVNQDEKVEGCLKTQDILLVFGGKILKANIFEAPKSGTYNLHNTLLPLFQGMGAIYKILEMYRLDNFNGITLHRVDSGVDTGEKIAQRHLPRKINESLESLNRRTFLNGLDLVFDFLHGQTRIQSPFKNETAIRLKQIPKLSTFQHSSAR